MLSKFTLNYRRKEALLFYILTAPFLILFAVIKLVPFIEGLWLSFTTYTGYNYGREKFVGLRNYIRVFSDADALYSLGRTFLISIITVPLGLGVGLGCALLLNKARKGVGVFRTILYLPSIIPAVAYVWLGYDLIVVSLVIMMTWGSTGGLLLNLAALQGIPDELYEAAAIDGANGWKKFTKITIPLISPVLFFNLLMGIINGLQLYTQPVLLSNGANGVLNLPLRPVYTYMVHTYQQILGYARFGYGLAMVWVLVLIINLLTVLVMKSQKFWVFYD